MEATLATIRPLVPHPPSQRQRDFLALDCEEALYGGAAGGGKTDALLIAALQYVDVPGYSAGLFRRHETDFALTGSILDLAHNWLRGTSAKWDGALHGYRFASGATLHFGSGAHFEGLRTTYQGSVFQFIGVDELTQWPERNYQYLFSRLRRLREQTQVPLRMRAAANPGGIGHIWVKRRFVEHARHARGSDARDDVRRRRIEALPTPAVYESPPTPEAAALAQELGRQVRGACFVPAFLDDNPGLDVSGYRGQLVRLDLVTRKQLEDGDWDVVSAGNLFKSTWFKFMKQPPVGLRWVRSWDLAATKPKPGRDPDWTAGVKMAADTLPTQEKRVIIGHCEHFQEDPGETELRIQTTGKLDGLGTQVVIEQEPGASGKSTIHGYQTRVLFGHSVHGFHRTGPKESYWKPLSALAHAGNVYLIEGDWNVAFVQELTDLPVGHDDQADAASAAYAWIAEQGSGAGRTAALVSAPW